MFVFYDWPFPQMCTLQRMQPTLHSLLILGSVFSDCVVFYGDSLIKKAQCCVNQQRRHSKDWQKSITLIKQAVAIHLLYSAPVPLDLCLHRVQVSAVAN